MTASRQRDILGRSPIDVHVGERLRLRRTLLRMSQEKLATALGLTFQQVQKYERAANRISASRLYQLCRVLKVPISFFFEEMDAEGRKAGPFASRKAAPSAPVQDDLLREPDTIELVEAYYQIGSPRLRARLLEFARGLADNEANSKRRGRPRTSRPVRTPSTD
jgi:transcriptional regulator with XRE-family HTH domain